MATIVPKMNQFTDPLFQHEFIGTLFFLPSNNDWSAICQLEFTTSGPDRVARIGLKDRHYEIANELLLCPDGEKRFCSRKEIPAYGDGPYVQLLLVADRLTHVCVDGTPHLRVVGDWIERAEDKNGRVRTTRWGIEGLLKKSGLPSSSLDERDKHALAALRRNWRQVSE